MVKAKECCCGCTLRQGSLILLWTVLILGCIEIIGVLSFLLSGKSITTVLTIRYLYSLMENGVGVTLSFLGLYGIQKNMPQYLTGSYYYLCYEVIYMGVLALVLIIYPSFYYQIISFESSKVPTHPLVLVMVYLFAIALYVYFTIIIKSLRDSMIKQKYSGGDTQTPADPSALGYYEA